MFWRTMLAVSTDIYYKLLLMPENLEIGSITTVPQTITYGPHSIAKTSVTPSKLSFSILNLFSVCRDHS